MAEEIRQRFGDLVAELVMHCTDSISTDPAAKAPWVERTTAYLTRLASGGPDAALVAAADKLSNLNATIRDARAEGPATLSRFARPDRLVWYYSSVTDAIAIHAGRVPLNELREAVATLAALRQQARIGSCQRARSASVSTPISKSGPSPTRPGLNTATASISGHEGVNSAAKCAL